MIACSSGDSDSYLLYTVSGAIFSNGTGISGVSVSMTGPTTLSEITDQGGNYTFKVTNSSYTITPESRGYRFTLDKLSIYHAF